MTTFPEPKLTRDECFRLLELYRDWNVDQKGTTEAGTAVLEARRDLLVGVYNRLEELT